MPDIIYVIEGPRYIGGRFGQLVTLLKGEFAVVRNGTYANSDQEGPIQVTKKLFASRLTAELEVKKLVPVAEVLP